MQRWIAVGVVATILLLGGAFFARRAYYDNRPQPIWVPLAIKADLPASKRDELIKKLHDGLSEEDVLVSVSKDVGLMQKWSLASDKEGARVIGERLFVRAGDMDTPMGKMPSIHIGVKGKAKESKVSGEIAVRMMKDVWEILEIPTPPPEMKN